MPKDIFSRYVWIVDTIRRHGSMTRSMLNEKWQLSQFSNGEPMSRRTFYNYRHAIEEIFQLNLAYNPVTFEYSVEPIGPRSDSITDWLLNSAAMSGVLNGARDIADRIFVENVPSARNFLDTVMEAMRSSMRLRFTYHPFTRSKPTPGIVIEPYFLKIFRQRWYVTGRNVADRKIKTYALDRMTEANVDSEPFEMPADFSPADYTRDSFGIIFDEGRTAEVRLRAEPRKAKYLRALPLHPSQQEMVHDSFSVFTYRLKLTGDLVDELMSHTPDIEVMSPPELRAMMRARLASGLDRYKS